MSKYLSTKAILVNAAIFCLIALVAGGVTILAQPADEPPMHPGGPGAHDPFGMMLRHTLGALNLTEDQRTQIRSILESHRPDEATLEQMRQARQALHQAVMDPESTDEQVTAAARNVSALMEQGAVTRHQVFLEIQQVLTDEQRQKLQEMAQELPDEGPGYRHHRGGPHGPHRGR